MSVRRPAADVLQPKSFSFNEKNLLVVDKILSKYPKEKKASALLPLLDLAQRQNANWISTAAMKVISEETSLNFDDDFICKISFSEPSEPGRLS